MNIKRDWKTFILLFRNLSILGLLVVSLVGGVNRVLWVNDDAALAFGSMPSTFVEEKLGVSLPSKCSYDKPQHIDFKQVSADLLKFRCSWFSGGGLTWWPFYSEIEVSDAESLDAFNAVF